MKSEFDDEMDRMDELERDVDPELHDAVSLNDPISVLELRPPVSVSTGTTIQEAADTLRKESIGCLMVEQDGKLVGILTERDFILKITGKGMDFSQEAIDPYMTHEPEYLFPSDSIAYALNKMYVSGFRHVPIVDEEKHPVGVVSIKDIINLISIYFGNEVLNLPPSPPREGFSTPEGG